MIMRTILILFSTCLISQSTFGQNSLAKGDSAYAEQNYELAIQHYTTLLGENYNSANLYYNLGNAYYKTNEIGESIWAYQKAKKINANHKDIDFNLNFVSNLTKDKIEQSKTGLGHWFSKIAFGKSINFWAWLGLLFSLLTATFIYLSRAAILNSFKSLYLLTSLICLILMVTTITIGIIQYRHITTINHGIVINPVVKVFTAPNHDDQVSFELHEGAKFKLIKTKEDWVNIELNKNEGWVKKMDILLY